MNDTRAHRHGVWTHRHHHHGPHRHARLPFRSDAPGEDHSLGEHGHTHGRIDPSIVRSQAGVKAVAISLGILSITAVLQALILMLSGSVALLADLIHNTGDALTAVPLGAAFLLRSQRGERGAGYFVVVTIFVSALVAGYEAIDRLIHPQDLDYLGVLAIAGVVGFVGNELVAQVRLHTGQRLDSPALVADSNHARADGYVSLGVVASSAFVAIGIEIADPLVGLAITGMILKITWDSWRTIRRGPDHQNGH
ncbi:MAG TPA: cation diffusion facilitator family transporter [Acidimicrobiia bacterium]